MNSLSPKSPHHKRQASCPAHYNNFEAVDMRGAFRGELHWGLFLAAERSNAFMCTAGSSSSAPSPQCGVGDAIYRTFAAALVLDRSEIREIAQNDIAYVHPVPIRGFCGKRSSITAVRHACEKEPALCAKLLTAKYGGGGDPQRRGAR